MIKINSSAILNHATLSPQSLQVPARPAMASHHLTPLTPPGSRLSDAGQSDVPQWRLALFDRAFEQIQQKLAERRHADSPVSAPISGGLSGAEFRECDAAAQWITASLMSSGAR
jgi:hypothetical protein